MELIIKKYSEILIAVVAIIICMGFLSPIASQVSDTFVNQVVKLESESENEWMIYESEGGD